MFKIGIMAKIDRIPPTIKISGGGINPSSAGIPKPRITAAPIGGPITIGIAT